MAKVDDNEQNRARCNCVKCPTMNECGRQKGERLFCAEGKGSCDYKTNGCICAACPVHRDNRLDNHYYCRNGAADKIG